MTRPVRLTLAAGAACAVVAVTLVGAGHPPRPAAHGHHLRSLLIPVPTASGTPTPSDTPTDSRPADPSGLSAALLAPAELPSLVPATDMWQETATYVDSGRSSDLPCQLGSVQDLGAQTQAYRTYKQAIKPGGKFTFYFAAHLIADFPTKDAAAAAATRLGSWIGQCSEDGYFPNAAVTPWAVGRWSVTSTVPGPDANPRFGDAGRADAEFSVQQRGTAVSVLYVGTETNGTAPRNLFQDAAAKSVARMH